MKITLTSLSVSMLHFCFPIENNELYYACSRYILTFPLTKTSTGTNEPNLIYFHVETISIFLLISKRVLVLTLICTLELI